MTPNDYEGGFTLVPNRVLFDDRLSAVELRVYATLLAFNWKPQGQPRKDVVWPSVGSIAELCGGLHRHTIQAALKRLEALGLIETELRRGGTGGGATNRYRLLATSDGQSSGHRWASDGQSSGHRWASDGQFSDSDGQFSDSDGHCSGHETEKRNRGKKQIAAAPAFVPAAQRMSTGPLTGSAVAQWQTEQPAYEEVDDGIVRYRCNQAVVTRFGFPPATAALLKAYSDIEPGPDGPAQYANWMAHNFPALDGVVSAWRRLTNDAKEALFDADDRLWDVASNADKLAHAVRAWQEATSRPATAEETRYLAHLATSAVDVSLADTIREAAASTDHLNLPYLTAICRRKAGIEWTPTPLVAKERHL